MYKDSYSVSTLMFGATANGGAFDPIKEEMGPYLIPDFDVS